MAVAHSYCYELLVSGLGIHSGSLNLHSEADWLASFHALPTQILQVTDLGTKVVLSRIFLFSKHTFM